jgi:patatin-like phospholipase/acyl hydrolase
LTHEITDLPVKGKTIMTYRILSLDGGGVRGQWATTILRRLEEALPGWIDEANLFAGASIGAVLALGLANGYKADQLEAMFYRYGPYLFQPSSSRIPTRLKRYFRAGYSAVPLNRLLDDFCGDARLGDLRKHVIIPAFKLDNEAANPSIRGWEPTVFHNFGSQKDAHCQIAIRQVILRATATPTIFPSVDGYVDGGIVANNPSMIALAHIQGRRCRCNGRSGAQDIVLLSIGTGYEPRHIEEERNDWGYIQWQKHLLDLITTGSMQLVDRQCRQFLGKRYRRLCPALTRKVHAFDISKLEMLIGLAESVDLSQTISWLRMYWLDHMPGQQVKPTTSVSVNWP